MSGGVIDPDYQGGTGLLLHYGDKEDCVCSAEDRRLEHLLVLPLAVIKVRGNCKTLNQAGRQRAQTIQG